MADAIEQEHNQCFGNTDGQDEDDQGFLHTNDKALN
jgi:hypothetical protein